MRYKVIIFLLIFSLSSILLLGDTSGYLSFEYIRGKDEGHSYRETFRNVQLGAIFYGDIIQSFDYTAEARYRESEVEIEQAWVRFRPSESFSLKAGLYLVHFGRYNQSNRPFQTVLINPPLNVDSMYPPSWRDIGLVIEGKTGSLFYSAYLGNGLAEAKDLKSSQQWEDNNAAKAKGVRIGLFISQQFLVGFSYYRAIYDEEGKRDLVLYGADITWETEGFYFQSEYSKAEIENPESFSPGKAEGYFIQVSLDIGKFRPVVSYQTLKYDDPFHGRGFILPTYRGRGILEDKRRWALAVVYFPSPSLLVKFEYDYNHERTWELKDDSYSAQVALSF